MKIQNWDIPGGRKRWKIDFSSRISENSQFEIIILGRNRQKLFSQTIMARNIGTNSNFGRL